MPIKMSSAMFALMLAAPCVIGTSLPAAAGEAAADTASRLVRISDLDLGRMQDQTTLKRRIDSAANRICVDMLGGGARDLAGQSACRATAVADAWGRAQKLIGAARGRSTFAAASPSWADPRPLVSASRPAATALVSR